MSLGVRLAAPTARTVCYVEREAFCAAVLVDKMRQAALDEAPVWTDLGTFDGKPWRGVVDLVTAGFPCQPYSVAGQRKGDDDERAIWPEIARIIEECEPGAVFLENVARSAFRRPTADLRSLGFECHPPCVATSQNFGAPDIRERWFVLATHAGRKGLEGCRESQRDGTEHTEHRSGGDGAADAAGDGSGRRPGRSEGTAVETRKESTGPDGDSASNTHPNSPHSHGHGLTGEWGGWVFDRDRQTLRHDPDRCSLGCRICGSHWEAESPPVRVDAGTASRVDELRAIGNVGAPPVVYAAAFRALAARAGMTVESL